MYKIAEALKEHRESRNLSQQKLAEECDLKQQSISRWEKGINVPDIISCIKLANYYGITLDELIYLK